MRLDPGTSPNLRHAFRLAHTLVCDLLRDLPDEKGPVAGEPNGRTTARDRPGAVELAAPPASKAARERLQRLRAAELPSLMLYAGIVVRVSARQRDEVLARVKRSPPAGDDVPADENEAVDEPLSREALRAAVEAEQPTLAHDIVERYVSPRAGTSTRTHYNLACFYAQLGNTDAAEAEHARDACLERALLELDLGLVDAGLLPWARADPSLRPLQELRPTRWDAVVSRHDASTPAAVPEPEALDPLAASLAAFSAGHGPASVVRAGTDVDFEVVTREGVVLVDGVTSGAATVVDVRRMIAAMRLWSAPGEQLLAGIIVLAPEVTVLPDALELAARASVRVMQLSTRGVMVERRA